MLWQKSWWETRWAFPIFLGLGLLLAASQRPWKQYWPFGRYEEYPWWNVYHLMSGETYLRYGRIPWLGSFAGLGASALMMFIAVRIYERRDF